MVATKMISRKRFFWLIITFVWVFISIIFLYIIDKSNNYNDNIITIDNNKKVAYKIFYTPLRLLNVESFVEINTKSDMCSKYIKKGVISLKYEHDEKLYDIDEYRSFNMDAKFKYKDPIKVIVKTKKDIGKCEFHVFVYPGKINIFLTGIILYLIPFFLVLSNVFLPIVREI